MRYEFRCHKCGFIQEINRPIKEGPPEFLVCPICDDKMYNVLGGNFILKGDGWPGKSIKLERTGEDPKAIEKTEKMRDELRAAQELSNEVLAERRKGTRHWREYKKKHPDKVEKYYQNLARGIRGK